MDKQVNAKPYDWDAERRARDEKLGCSGESTVHIRPPIDAPVDAESSSLFLPGVLVGASSVGVIVVLLIVAGVL